MTNGDRWRRIAVASGIVAALAVVVAAYEIGSTPKDGEEATEIESTSVVTRAVARVRKAISSREEFRIPAGTTLAVRIRTHVSSRDARRGDPVLAITTEDLAVRGRVLVPAGSTVQGRVTEVRPAAETRSKAVLVVGFHQIGAYAADLSLSSPDLAQRAQNANRAADAALVVGGAVAGAVIGNQTDARRGKEIGAVLGGATGAVAAANLGANVQLMRDEPGVLRFTRDLVVSE